VTDSCASAAPQHVATAQTKTNRRDHICSDAFVTSAPIELRFIGLAPLVATFVPCPVSHTTLPTQHGTARLPNDEVQNRPGVRLTGKNSRRLNASLNPNV